MSSVMSLVPVNRFLNSGLVFLLRYSHLVFAPDVWRASRLPLLFIGSVLSVPTGCSGGLRPCVWRGAEGRGAPGRGGRTGAAGTVFLLQERAVQTAWRVEEEGRDDTQPTQSRARRVKKNNNKKNVGQKTRDEATQQTREMKTDETGGQERQNKRGKEEDRRSESRHEKFKGLRGKEVRGRKDDGGRRESRGNP